jgi:hypothetical protein
MQEQTQTQETLTSQGVPQRMYTPSEVAGHLGIREDDLMIVLPNAALVVAARMSEGFTSADVELLEQFIRSVRKFAAESVYGGGDL